MFIYVFESKLDANRLATSRQRLGIESRKKQFGVVKTSRIELSSFNQQLQTTILVHLERCYVRKKIFNFINLLFDTFLERQPETLYK